MMEAVASDQKARTKRASERTCVGCGRADAPKALVRLVGIPTSVVDSPTVADIGSASVVEISCIAADVGSGLPGRGAHVHPRVDCLERACRGGLARSFRKEIRVT